MMQGGLALVLLGLLCLAVLGLGLAVWRQTRAQADPVQALAACLPQALQPLQLQAERTERELGKNSCRPRKPRAKSCSKA